MNGNLYVIYLCLYYFYYYYELDGELHPTVCMYVIKYGKMVL